MIFRFSVIIPCYPPHQKHLPFLVNQLNNQTRLPDEIIIGHSELSDVDAETLETELQSLTKIPLFIVPTPEKQRAAVNRNNASYLARGQYLVWLDADDSYSPYLLELIEEIIREDDPDSIMYCFGNEEPSIPEVLPVVTCAEIFKYTWPDGIRNRDDEIKYRVCPMIKSGPLPHDRYGGLHGHLVLKRSIWEELPQPDIPGREDAVYCRDIIWRWHEKGRKTSGFIFLWFPLVKYRFHEREAEKLALNANQFNGQTTSNNVESSEGETS